jgi:K(+)-stimulated pyrophosphate-energized sodium pump
MSLIDPSLFALGVGIVAILVAVYIISWILRQDSGNDRIKEVGKYIASGTNTYLNRQIKTISLIMPLLAVIIFFLFNWKTSVTFVCGVVFSILAGYIGMNVAVRANMRTTSAATKSSAATLRVAFLGGAVTGLLVVTLSILGLYLLNIVFNDIEALVGFGFGASLAALFSQIGGGIYTKSADIGADLVGKIEEEIPEDDPRNAAVIADLVGDNVGDCAGRGSDLFQNISGDIVTGMIIGLAFVWRYGPNAIMFPFAMEAMGLLASIVGIALVREWKGISPTGSLFIGLLVTTLASIVGMYFLSTLFLNDVTVVLSVLCGLGAELVAIIAALYYTGLGHKPVKRVAEASQGGPALNIITGLSFGLQSPLFPLIALLAAIVSSFILSAQSLFSLVIVNIATDLQVAFIMSCDTFGPITDNAGGIAEMAGVSSQAGKILDHLDSVGNTMKASTKGYGMACGTFTSFVVFATYFASANITNITVSNPFGLSALFLGVLLPLPFASLTISATANGAFKMVDEVRRQFREIPGLRDGKATPDYAKCIDISTKYALKGMILPGLLAVAVPVVVGLLFGPYVLGMLLVGATASSAILGFFFSNTGGLLDNAKKLVGGGLYGGKGSDTHKATIVGDTVGDPMKDVVGPSLLIFMKFLGMTALLLLPYFLLHI